MQQNHIKLKPIEENLGGELSEIIYYECAFCQKTVGLYPPQRKLCEKLSGTKFFCQNCIQNGFNSRNNQHILMMTFRGIIGFYHQVLYLGHGQNQNNKKLYHSQIHDCIESHEEVGRSNPLFRYDPESFIWFVDFSRVGKGKRKIHVKEVLKTTVNMLFCFNLPLTIEHLRPSKIYEKYEEAINKFHTHRYRPANKRILSPTLMNCGGLCDVKTVPHESLRNFTNREFLMKSY